jgi:hypothetical protein
MSWPRPCEAEPGDPEGLVELAVGVVLLLAHRLLACGKGALHEVARLLEADLLRLLGGLRPRRVLAALRELHLAVEALATRGKALRGKLAREVLVLPREVGIEVGRGALVGRIGTALRIGREVL